MSSFKIRLDELVKKKKEIKKEREELNNLFSVYNLEIERNVKQQTI
jgi:hypothetical protein